MAPTSLAATKSCADQIVADWYGDGRVDKIYRIPCYQEAIRSLPVDVLDYSNAREDILRALAYAKQGKPDPGPSGGAGPTGTTPGDPTGTTGTRRLRRRDERGRRRRHVGAVVRADPAPGPRRAGAAPARRGRRRLPEPSRTGTARGRAPRPGLSRTGASTTR